MRTLSYISSLSLILILGVFCFQANGQSTENTVQTSLSGDSLSLTQIMQVVIQSHPSIKEAEEAINIADAKIGMARSSYYPNVDASASYSRIGPVPTIEFPGLGNFQLYPQDNYSAAVNYNQVIYDFGKTKKSVGLENENKILAEKNADLAK
ncbi:MAG TPA: TolC family protein, partial [Bacteroidales bacterium]